MRTANEYLCRVGVGFLNDHTVLFCACKHFLFLSAVDRALKNGRIIDDGSKGEVLNRHSLPSMLESSVTLVWQHGRF